MRISSVVCVVAWCVMGLVCRSAMGIEQREIEVSVSSGDVVVEPATDAGGGGVVRPEHRAVWSRVIEIEESEWVRLGFGETVLSAGSELSRASYLRVTSVLDGHQQFLDREGLAEWRDTTAYFNGASVLVELMVSPGADTRVNKVEIDMVMASMPRLAGRSLCADDDRVVSSDPRAGRLMPIECTAWLVGTQGRCMITAGHCQLGNGGDVVQFNVPLSSVTGTAMHPGPEDQYPVDPASIQDTGGASSLGNDWGVFGVFDNANTGLSALAAQGASYELATQAPAVDGRSIRITGYGLTSAPVSATWNLVQKTDAGPLVDWVSTIVTYAADSTGGNSGGAVLDEVTGKVIAIHTNAGCDGIGGNQGCSVFNTGLQSALANPQGICRPLGLELAIKGQPIGLVAPGGGDVVSVSVGGGEGIEPTGAVRMMLDVGAGFEPIAMSDVGGGVYEGKFPVIECAALIRYFFEADGDDGSLWTLPNDGAVEAFDAVAGDDDFVSVFDSYQEESGWVVSDAGITTGSWVREVPGDFGRNDPTADFDGSGVCFVTGNSLGEDVDSGSTALRSPAYDLVGIDGPMVEFASWFFNDDGDDVLRVDFSDDDGASWVVVASIGTTTGWHEEMIPVAPYVKITDQFRVRFVVADSPNNSVTEAAVDAFAITGLICNPACAADLEPDGVLNLQDVFAFLSLFNAGDPLADFVPDGMLNLQDLFEYLEFYTAGCP